MQRLKIQRGETIVEVLICVIILGFTLSTVFVIAGRSLSTGQASNERTQALSIVESQIERLRYMADAGKTEIYDESKLYCVTPISTLVDNVADSDQCFGTFPDADMKLRVSFEKEGNPATIYDDNTFTVTADWTRVGGGSGTDSETLTLVYRLPERADITPITPVSPPAPASCTLTANAQPPIATNWTLSWVINDAQSATLTPAVGGVSSFAVPPTTGSTAVFSVPYDSTTNYQLDLIGIGGNGSCTAPIVVGPAPLPASPPSCTITRTVLGGGQEQISWSMQNTVQIMAKNLPNGEPLSVTNGSTDFTPVVGNTYSFSMTVRNSAGVDATCSWPPYTIPLATSCPARATTVNIVNYTHGFDYGINLDQPVTQHGHFTFDPWYSGRINVKPDLRVDFPIETGCKYKLNYTAYCKGPYPTFIPFAEDPNCNNPMTNDQPAERARLIFYDGRTSDDTRTLECNGNKLGYFDTEDKSRGPSGQPNFDSGWEGEVTGLAFGPGNVNVRCIDFVHVCDSSLSPPPVLSPGDCSAQSSVYFHILTFTQIN